MKAISLLTILLLASSLHSLEIEFPIYSETLTKQQQAKIDVWIKSLQDVCKTLHKQVQDNCQQLTEEFSTNVQKKVYTPDNRLIVKYLCEKVQFDSTHKFKDALEIKAGCDEYGQELFDESMLSEADKMMTEEYPFEVVTSVMD